MVEKTLLHCVGTYRFHTKFEKLSNNILIVVLFPNILNTYIKQLKVETCNKEIIN
jgi:hypothetical protein